jgi:hypothetical protein
MKYLNYIFLEYFRLFINIKIKCIKMPSNNPNKQHQQQREVEAMPSFVNQHFTGKYFVIQYFVLSLEYNIFLKFSSNRS